MTPIRRQTAARLFALCSCRRFFDWRAAQFVGIQQDDVWRLEVRRCSHCGSTRGLMVAFDAAALAAEGRAA